MIHYFRAHWAVLLIYMALLFSSSVHGVTVVERDFDEILDRSDEVFYGRVTDMHSQYENNEFGQSIFTYIQFSDIKRVKDVDTQNAHSYLLRVAGGRVANTVQMFPGMPQFEMGKRYVIFVRDNNKVAFPLVGIQQGFIAVVDDSKNGRHTLAFSKTTEKIKTRFSDIKRELNLVDNDKSLDPEDFILVLREYWNLRKFKLKKVVEGR
jgi:hypothetical protein